MLDIELGKYELVGPHKGCEHNGQLMKCSLHKVNGELYPKGEEQTEWLWCNGRKWVFEGHSWKRVICGYSTRK